jgi:hypothetical protein
MASKDKATGGSGTQVMISADELQNLATRMKELDAKIASASGNDAAARKAWVESLISQNAEQVNGIADSVITQLAELDFPTLVGLVARLEDRIKSELAPKVDAYVAEEFPKTQTTSKEEVETLKTERKELTTSFRALREVLNSFKIPNDFVEEPKRSGGGRPAGSGGGSTKSGANKEGYRYFIDGNKRPKSQNSFSSVAFYATTNCPTKVMEANGVSAEDIKKASPRARWTAGELKTFLGEQGVKFGEDDTFEVTLPNGKKVSARRFTDEDKIDLQIVDDANETGTEAPTADATEPVGAAAGV